MAVNKVVANGETKLDLSNDTVTADTLLSGVTAHNAAGIAVTGTVDMNSKQDKITANGILKGNGAGSVSAAVAGTDYATPESVAARQDKITASGFLYGRGGGLVVAAAESDFPKEVFVATAGTTPLADIQAAIRAGKDVILKKDSSSLSEFARLSMTGYSESIIQFVKSSGKYSTTYAYNGSATPSETTTTMVTADELTTRLNRSSNVNAADTSYGTYMARGIALSASEVTPTANGTIAFVYE